MKDSLGTSNELLARFTEAVSDSLKQSERVTPQYVWLQSRPRTGREPIEVRIPLANLAKELEEQLPRAAAYQDLTRGRKRPGWKGEFARKIQPAARDLSGVTEAQIIETIRAYRAEKKRLPEIRVGRSEKSS